MALLRPPFARRRAASFGLAAGALALLLVAGLPAAAQDQALEYAVKATYLYKFAPFVEWPSRAFAGPATPFSICVVGQDPFGAALDHAVAGQAVGGRRVVVRRLQAVSGDPGCHVLYVGRSRAEPVVEVLRAVRGLPVLTVTDDGQGTDGGIVQFELREGRVRFSLDAAAAEASGLALSSKLQSLATRVRRPE